MGWYMTSDLDRFLATAGDYLESRAAENALLLSAAQTAHAELDTYAALDARDGQAAGEAATGPGPLCGWWDPPDGRGPRGAFLHDPSVPLLIAVRRVPPAEQRAGAGGRLVGGLTVVRVERGESGELGARGLGGRQEERVLGSPRL